MCVNTPLPKVSTWQNEHQLLFLFCFCYRESHSGMVKTWHPMELVLEIWAIRRPHWPLLEREPVIPTISVTHPHTRCQVSLAPVVGRQKVIMALASIDQCWSLICVTLPGRGVFLMSPGACRHTCAFESSGGLGSGICLHVCWVVCGWAVQLYYTFGAANNVK